MSTLEWLVNVDGGAVSAVYESASTGPDAAVFVCAHGAGGNMMDRGLVATANALRNHGIGVVRFNFLYREKKSGRPDSMPVLQSTVAGVVEHVRLSVTPAKAGAHMPLLIGGRSMGGRAASMLAADGFQADGLLLLAYPLHPAGKPAKLRDEHLRRIDMPVLCINGTRDPLCTRSLMEQVLATAARPKWTMHWIEGADHSFHVLKSSGRSDAQVQDEIAVTARGWIDHLP